MKNINKFYKEKSKKVFIVYTLFSIAIIAMAVLQLIRKNYGSFIICVLTLILYMMPYFLSKKFKICFPSGLEIMIFIFLFCSIILGEIQSFFGVFDHWDTLLHMMNGFISSAIGFSLIDLLNKTDKLHVKMSSFFVTSVAICFSMTIGVFWEFFEYGADRLLNFDMQKDSLVQVLPSTYLGEKGKNEVVIVDDIKKTVIYGKINGKEEEVVIDGGFLDMGVKDTMDDMFDNLFGSLIFGVLCLLYMKGLDRFNITDKFLVRKEL